MKRMLTLILALSMALSLAACGGGEDTPSTDEGGGDAGSGETTKMTLILRGGAYGESLQAMLEPFAEEHNVEFEVLLQEFDALHTGIALDAVNETGTYDLCMVDGSWMAEFTENGVLANLSEMGYSFDDDVIPATTSICMVDDDIYLAPYYGNVFAIYNRSSIFFVRRTHKIYTRQIFIGGKNVYMILSGYPHEPRQAGTTSYKESLVTLFLEFFYLYCLSYNAVFYELHPEFS